MRGAKAVLICRKTGQFRAVQLLLGHSVVRNFGVEIEDALNIAENIDIYGPGEWSHVVAGPMSAESGKFQMLYCA